MNDIVNKNNYLAQQQVGLQNKFNTAIKVVGDVVLKNYLNDLHDFDVIPVSNAIKKENLSENIRIFKITEMVYEKNEFSTYKFATVFNALASSQCSVFVMIDSNGTKTDFYMGIRSLDPDKTSVLLKKTLEKALKGQFPGVQTLDYLDDDMNDLFGKVNADNISMVSCVANSKNADNHEERSFVQGLEKFVVAMQGERYTGIILATSTTQEQIAQTRKKYEDIYTNLVTFSKSQMSNSLSDAISTSKAFNEGTSYSTNSSRTHSKSNSTSKSTTHTDGTSYSESKQNPTSIALNVGTSAVTSLVAAGALSAVTGGAFPVAVGAVAAIFGKTRTKGKSSSDSYSNSSSESYSSGYTDGYTSGTSQSRTDTEGQTQTTGQTMTLNMENKTITDILERIDLQLKRLKEFESLGMWECAAYFMSNKLDVAEIASSTYKALMCGENSGVEVNAINTWKDYEDENTRKTLKDYILHMTHPQFMYRNGAEQTEIFPCSLVSGNELAIHMGLPRKSVSGFPVIEHADFGREVVNYDHQESGKTINLGKIFNMGSASKNDVLLDCESLSMHTFITGATGSGKSNTVYTILEKLGYYKVKYLIIEPAKGEYKNVFGMDKNVKVFGSNPAVTPLLKINPFRFPKGIHVFEHIDRLIEIFNVCWPMYAAMPAVLKDAILNAYEACGWDLESSTNEIGEYYPNFLDVLEQLREVMDKSSYDSELKNNYKGSLETRIKSLTNGLNGQIFTDNEIDSAVLFDSNVIVDLSRIGSLETKSLIMGLLVMRLGEYRMVTAKGMNENLKHVTVLEEAHNILKRSTGSQSVEGNDLTGKSVEMLSNAIAEMRTYGEGFIIADQSPNAVDMAAIRNTNTKIIMRLPDENDRRLAGKSAALKDVQLDEIAKLPKGVAIVYQNDWIEPVLCKVNRFSKNEQIYVNKNKSNEEKLSIKILNGVLLTFLLKKKLAQNVNLDIVSLKNVVGKLNISTKLKCKLTQRIEEYQKTRTLSIWKEDKAVELCIYVIEVLDCQSQLDSLMQYSKNKAKLDKELNKLLDNKLSAKADDALRDEVKKVLLMYIQQ